MQFIINKHSEDVELVCQLLKEKEGDWWYLFKSSSSLFCGNKILDLVYPHLHVRVKSKIDSLM